MDWSGGTMNKTYQLLKFEDAVTLLYLDHGYDTPGLHDLVDDVVESIRREQEKSSVDIWCTKDIQIGS